MGYSDTKTFNITAAGTTGPNVIDALIAHFTSAPGRWEIKSGVSPVAGAALTIRRKTNPLEVGDINIRWDSAGYFWGAVDPSGTITASGNTTTAPTMGPNASPEARTNTLGSINAAIVVEEYDDAITILIRNAAKSVMLHGFHQGIGYMPNRQNGPTYGLTGHVNLVGAPSQGSPTGSAFFWLSTGTSSVANQSRVRGFNSAGVAVWSQAGSYQTVNASGNTISPISADEAIKFVQPLSIQALDYNGINDLSVGLSKWIGAAPFDSTVFPARLPGQRMESPVEAEAWLYSRETVTATCFVINHEKSVPLA